MTALDTKQFRKIVRDRLGDFIDRTDEDRESNPIPPPQLIEGMVSIETGGTFDPEFIDPKSGAIGLGQILPGGLEWGVYKANHPKAKESDLTKPETNLDVMIEGLSYRKHLGDVEQGVWSDWYLSAGGYLGGLNDSGTDNGSDAYGTSWRDYVRAVRNYIAERWSESTAQSVDDIGAVGVIAEGGDWESGEIRFDRSDPAASDPQLLTFQLAAEYTQGDPIGSVVGWVKKNTVDVATDVAGEVLDRLLGYIGAVAPRVGLAFGGIALFSIGAMILLRPAINREAARQGIKSGG